MINFSLLKKLTEISGVSGDERFIRSIIKEELTPYSETIRYDNLGSIICYQQYDPQKPTIALIAHIDEVGFLIQDIDKNGFIRLYALGGISPHQVIGTRVLINHKLLGCIYSDKDPSKDITINNLYVDAGFTTKEEVLSNKIRIGHSISFRVETEYWKNQGIIAGKALDNRISCYIGIEVFKQLFNKQLDSNLIFIGTVQEEVGTRGAITSMNVIELDMAIILDVASSKDILPSSKSRLLKYGPCLCIADKSALGNQQIIQLFSEIADNHGIPYQYDILGGGGTDTGAVSLHNKGIPAMAVITPVRYCHTATSLVHQDDILHTITLLIKSIESITQDNYLNILPYTGD